MKPALLMSLLWIGAVHASAGQSSITTPSVCVMADDTECSLRSTLDAHLAAIQARDLRALLATVTSGNELTLIFPDGEKLDSRRQYVDFHKTWFPDKTWHMETEVLNLIETAELGHALVKYRYTSQDPSGEPKTSESYLALTFARENGCWRLVFDQNTRIEMH